MTSRIETVFKSSGKKLVTYIVAGDPDIKTSQIILETLANSGADIIELGMPFTDPVADGPVIQAAALRALAAGATVKTTLQMVAEFRERNTATPIVLMGYYNPLFSYGIKKFVVDAVNAGVDGLLIVDLPTEEEEELCVPAREAGLDFIRLVTPTTGEARLKQILKNASGFVYYVAVSGITGGVSATPETLQPRIDFIKRHTQLPVCIGFGIKTPDDARQISEIADGVVVGSAIVQMCDSLKDSPNESNAIAAFVKDLSQSI